jgi:hypothetical protein
MHGLSQTTWRQARTLIGAAAAVAALAVSAAPAAATRHDDVRYGHKIGAQRAEQRSPLFGREVGSRRSEPGRRFHGHKIS